MSGTPVVIGKRAESSCDHLRYFITLKIPLARLHTTRDESEGGYDVALIEKEVEVSEQEFSSIKLFDRLPEYA